MRPLLLGVVALAVLLPGCGPGRGDLAGRVTYAGKPLQVGSVVLLASDQVPRPVPIQNGRYMATDVPAGLVKLSVVSADPKAAAASSRKYKEEKRAVPETAGWFPIPEKYGSFDRSDLTFRVEPGANTFDLHLKGP